MNKTHIQVTEARSLSPTPRLCPKMKLWLNQAFVVLVPAAGSKPFLPQDAAEPSVKAGVVRLQKGPDQLGATSYFPLLTKKACS